MRGGYSCGQKSNRLHKIVLLGRESANPNRFSGRNRLICSEMPKVSNVGSPLTNRVPRTKIYSLLDLEGVNGVNNFIGFG